jgi:fumarate reductase flavoprotein subunit
MATKVMDCDLIVLGAGGAGMVAAVKAADVSGKKVIVLEKAKKPGGCTIFAHGMQIQDSKWQKEAGETVNDPPNISGQFFDWLVTKGGIEQYWRMAKPGEIMNSMTTVIMPNRMDKYRGHPDPTIGPGWIGSYVVGKMLECCEKMGIPVLTETRAKKFMTDPNGKVTGVLADTTDGQLLVNCKACFIGAGSFGANYEKCQKLWPEEYNNKPYCNLCPPTNTGDCIDMAEEIGAAVDLSNAFHTGGGNSISRHPYTHSVHKMIESPPMMFVNLNGKRWSRPASENGYHFGPDSLPGQPKAGVFAIADYPTIEMVGNALRPNEEIDAPIIKKWREELAWEVSLDEKGAHGDHVKKADTLVELALKMNVDPKTFIATIEEYNKACENGTAQPAGNTSGSGSFRRGGDESLPPGFGGSGGSRVGGGIVASTVKPIYRPISTPPFYAIWCHRFLQTTKGGIVVDYNTTEVFDKSGRIMPGLFAGGDGITAKALKRTGPGSGLWNCITMGYKGGIAAGNYLKNL